MASAREVFNQSFFIRRLTNSKNEGGKLTGLPDLANRSGTGFS
jgi:hypothetical protein